MKLFSKEQRWYEGGLAFECVKCGHCCEGPEEGYVWVTRDDIAAIAKHLGITPGEMSGRYTRRSGRRHSLVEKANRDCVFLTGDGEGRKVCRIYHLRPVQCRTWPFWPSNIRSPEAWLMAAQRCPGINCGELLKADHVQAKADETIE